MFCLYCGNTLPDDALFCNTCGKRQQASTNPSMSGRALLPNSSVPNVPSIAGQTLQGSAPMVQGTPQIGGLPSVQGIPTAPVHGFAGNAASFPHLSAGSSGLSQAPSPGSYVDLPQGQKGHHQPGHHGVHPPHPHHKQNERPDTEPEPTPGNKHYSRHHKQNEMQHIGLKTAGNLSRRAVLLGITGTTTLVVAGGGLLWLGHARNSPAPIHSVSSLGTLLYTYHNDAEVLAVAWSPDGKRVLSSTDNARIGAPSPNPRSWNALTGSNSVAYRTGQFTYGAASIAWSSDGKYIVAGDATDNQSVEVWDATTAKLLLTYAHRTGLPYGAVNAVAWSPDSHYFASGGEDEKVQVWDFTLQRHIYTYQGHTGTIYGLAWAPDGKRIASASGRSIYPQQMSDNTIQVWDATNGGNVYSYQGHRGEVFAVSWSPGGKQIASGSSDHTVQVWDAINAATISTYQGHTNQVYAVTYSPDGKRIASGGRDATVQIWDATTGTTLYTYRGHHDEVNAIAWSPDGKYIASGGKDKTVQVWQAK